jgi:hypothetical protein
MAAGRTGGSGGGRRRGGGTPSPRTRDPPPQEEEILAEMDDLTLGVTQPDPRRQEMTPGRAGSRVLFEDTPGVSQPGKVSQEAPRVDDSSPGGDTTTSRTISMPLPDEGMRVDTLRRAREEVTVQNEESYSEMVPQGEPRVEATAHRPIPTSLPFEGMSPEAMRRALSAATVRIEQLERVAARDSSTRLSTLTEGEEY